MIQAFIPTSYSLDVTYPNVKTRGSYEAPAAAESLSWQQQSQCKMESENMGSGVSKFKGLKFKDKSKQQQAWILVCWLRITIGWVAPKNNYQLW